MLANASLQMLNLLQLLRDGATYLTVAIANHDLHLKVQLGQSLPQPLLFRL